MSARVIRPLLLAMACTVALAGCQSSEDKVKEYLDSARELVAQEEYEKAQLQLRNVLKIDNRSAEAYLTLADIYEQQGKFQQMFSALTEASGIDDKSARAWRGLAKLFLMSGEFDKARENLDKAMALDAMHPQTRLISALLMSRRGEADEAMAALSALYADAPGELEVVVAYAGMLVQRQDVNRALEIILEAQPRFPDATVLRMMQFQIHAGRQEVEPAAAVLQALIDTKPTDIEYRKTLALYRARTGNMGAAEQVLRDSVAANPDSVDAKLLLASFLGTRDKQSAVDALKGFVQSSPDAAKLKFALAEMYLRDGELGEASEVFQGIAGGDFSNEEVLGAKNELTRIALRENNTPEAKRIIDEVLTADAQNADALQARAVIALGERRTDEAIADLRIVTRDQPQSDQARLLLARAYLQNQSRELAEQALHDALELNPLNADAALLYARGRLAKQDFKGALDTLDRLLSGGKINQDAENLRIQIRLIQKDWKSATDLAAGVARSTSNPAYERYILALTLFGQERYAESIEMFRSVITENPSMEGALGGAARAYRAAGTPEQGIAFLREHVGAHPESLLARNLLAEELARSGDLAAAQAVYREAITAKPDVPGLYRALATLLTREKQLEQAAQVLREGIVTVANPLDLKLQLAMTLESLSQPDEAIALYRELLEKVPALDVAANNLAVLLAGDGSNPERLAEAARVAARFESSEQPWFADTLGWIYWQQKNYAKAAELLTRAAKAAPGEPLFHYHAAAVLFELKDFAAARKHLEETEKLVAGGRTYPEHKDALALLARLPEVP